MNYSFLKSVFLVILLLCSFHDVFADSSDSNSGKDTHKKSSAIVVADAPSLRAPARVDVLLVIEESGITIRFNGDFGLGYFQLTDNVTGITSSGAVIAETGTSEYVPYPVSTITSFNFYIEFEDGSWSQLSWGN